MASADHAHWGIAAYLFSLDLSSDLANFAMPDVPWGSLRPAIRDSILWNRQTVDAGHPPVDLRNAVGLALQHRGITPPAGFLHFVEQQLVTAGRPANAFAPLLAPLSDPALLARVDTALKTPESYAALVHTAIDAAASEMLLDAVFATDNLIDRKDLSDWDRAIIARNAENHAPENPLAPLIHSLTHALLRDAADRVAQALTPDQRASLHQLCNHSVPT